MTKHLPTNCHITYQTNYRRCGKKTKCKTCRNGQGHGPYFYANWHDPLTKKLVCKYMGKAPGEGAYV